MASQTKTRVLGRYIERSIALGLALSVPAVGLLVAAAFVSGPLGVVLASIGSTLGTVALLSFLYDPFLKDILAAEIFERVGLREAEGRNAYPAVVGWVWVSSASRACTNRTAIAPSPTARANFPAAASTQLLSSPHDSGDALWATAPARRRGAFCAAALATAAAGR